MSHESDDTFITQQKGRADNAPAPTYKEPRGDVILHQNSPKESKQQLYELMPLHISEATRLHAMMRDMKEMDEKLQATRRSYADRIAAVRLGQQEFLTKQQQTIEDLRKLRWFIISLDERRILAEKRAAAENEHVANISKEIQSVSVELVKVKEKLSVVKRKFKRHVQKKAYLESILSDSSNPKSAQFTAIDDIVRRYNLLDSSNSDLQKIGQHLQSDIDKIHADIHQLHKRKDVELMVNNGKLAHLTKQLETISKQVASLEVEAASHAKLGGDSSRRYGEIIQAISNLHNRACEYPTSKNKEHQQQLGHRSRIEGVDLELAADHSKGSPIPVASVEEILKQVEKIGNNVGDMIEIVNELKPLDRSMIASQRHAAGVRSKREKTSARGEPVPVSVAPNN